VPICDKCGTGLPVGYEYCFKCGYPVRGLPDDADETADHDATTPEDSADTWSVAPDRVPDAPRADAPADATPPAGWPPTAPQPSWQPPPPPSSGPPPGQPQGWQPYAQAEQAAGPYYAPGRPVALVPQGWPRRLLAFIIDYLVVAVPVGIITVVALAASGRVDLYRQATLNDLLHGEQTFFSAGQQTIVLVAVLAMLFAYCAVLEGAWGATLGKRVLGLRVVREADLGPCGWAASLARNGFKVATLALMPFGAVIPLVAMAFDPALHRRVGDRVAHTVVVREVVAPATAWQPPPPPQQPWGGN